MLEKDYIQTPFGIFYGIASAETDEAGRICSVRLKERNVIITHAGELIPYFGEDSPRRKYKASVRFHKNGMIQSVSLEQQQEILTPIGEFPAELVLFYDTGELMRFFPLDGKISGFWLEQEEKTLHIPFSFSFDFSEFTAILTSVSFYKSGNIRSITLYPGETITVRTPARETVPVRNGFALYEEGTLKSLEPDAPTPIATPIGNVNAYDYGALGIHADSNSLAFAADGRVTELITSTDKIAVTERDGSLKLFTPLSVENPLDDSAGWVIGLKLYFDYEKNTITITEGENTSVFKMDQCSFHIFAEQVLGCTSLDCAGCSLCSQSSKTPHAHE